jgi:hypothetical protein
MAKSDFEPKPPKIPEVGDKIGQLDGWVSSEDPHEGRFVDKDDDCDQEHASR